MNNFFHRLKLRFKEPKIISWYFLYQLTMMDLGRWLFKQAKCCYRCGSPATICYGKEGATCSLCNAIKEELNYE